jgi:hypothetical protein
MRRLQQVTNPIDHWSLFLSLIFSISHKQEMSLTLSNGSVVLLAIGLARKLFQKSQTQTLSPMWYYTSNFQKMKSRRFASRLKKWRRSELLLFYKISSFFLQHSNTKLHKFCNLVASQFQLHFDDVEVGQYKELWFLLSNFLWLVVDTNLYLQFLEVTRQFFFFFCVEKSS